MIALAIAAAVVAGPTGVYDCSLDDVSAVDVEHGKAIASMIEGLPTEALKFRIIYQGDNATVDWPNSPIQASGKQTVLGTAPGAGMILMVAPGPCLFTEAACASMLNYAHQADGSLKLLLTPTAVTYDKDHNTRFPFLVSIRGICTPAKATK
jgi:hypothetical protein